MKTVIRQKTFEKIYSCGIYKIYEKDEYGLSYMESVVPLECLYSDSINKEISDDIIGTYDFSPMVKIDETVFLTDLQIHVTIKSIIRNSDNSLTCYIEEKLIETENTKITFEESQKAIDNWNHDEERYIKLEEEINTLDVYKKKCNKHKFLNYIMDLLDKYLK